MLPKKHSFQLCRAKLNEFLNFFIKVLNLILSNINIAY